MTNDYLRPLSMHFPGKLVFGNGSLSGLPAEIAATGSKNAFVITIEPLLTALQSFFDELKSSGVVVSVNTGIVQEPYYSDFEKLLTEAETINPDTVIGIGGGSVLDVAKLIAALTSNRQPLSAIAGIGLLKGRSKKLVCVPATSGTGSEVSPNAILIDDADDQKKGIISPHLVPDMVYVDPLLTISVPQAITAATGLDALTHCLEAYTNKFALPFIDMYAYEGMRLIAVNLVNAVKNGSDEEARSQVAMGSLLGGFCLGPVNTAGVHALSYPLGSMFHLAHGLSNALLLPYVMEFNLPAAPARYADVAVALGCRRVGNDIETAEKGIEKIRQLINECGVPPRLRDVSVPKESLRAMAKDAMKIQRLLKNNPREISEEDAIHIYNEAY
ncbi:MAG TPA: iron-containing alcohol dehydrogenase [Mucilaginibacter sp.]|nr:iron-containing alcohol dehydrogenase [Mucilaginibacter sp.]